MPVSTELFSTAGASPFGRRQRRARGARIPVTVVTGFLGSGKTTLIRELLRRTEGANTAIVINEFGEVGIDDALLRTSSDATVLLGNGCLCCTVRTDLQESLRALFADRARGAVPGFERVVIETSGLADPGPVLQTFASDRALGEEFHLQSLVTVLDAVNGAANLDRMPEARHQVALADRIVLSKTDTADAGTIEELPRGFANSARRRSWPHRTARSTPAFCSTKRPIWRRGSPHIFTTTRTPIRTGSRVFPLFFDAPLPWKVFEQVMAVLTALRGPDLLRVKGLVAVTGCKGPVVVHAVQHVAHRPIELEDWPDGDRRSRLVFITRGLKQEAVEQLFRAVRVVGTVGDPPA